jgi:hypothetical protein
VTALDGIRHPRREQEGATAFGGLGLEHRAHLAHQAGKVFAIVDTKALLPSVSPCASAVHGSLWLHFSKPL